MQPKTCNRSGFATFTAIVMLLIVGSALLALTLLLQDDLRRSSRHGAETQLRQLLIAGGEAARQAVEPHNAALTGMTTITVPHDLEDAHLSVSYEQSGPNTILATVTARAGDFESAQVMRFELAESRWGLSDVEITRHY